MTVSTEDRTRRHPDPRSIANAMWPAAAVIAVQLVVYPVPVGVWLQGLVVGLLNAVVVLGIMLVYRANRVINLAQASVGAFPTALAAGVILFGAPGLVGTSVMAVPAGLTVGFVAYSVFRVDLRRAALAGLATAVAMAVLVQGAGRLGYVGGVLVGLVVAVLTGAGIDAVVVRRFRLSARLVLTVATIGLAQFYAVGSLLAPRVWNHIQLTNGSRTSFGVPGGVRFAIGRTVFGGNEILAVIVSVVAIAVVATALRRTDIGVAVRAVADRSDRASMLGIPVARLECGVWVVAVVLAFVGTFLQSAILGLQLSAGVGLRVLVAALAALALGGFATLPATLSAAVAVGILAQTSGPASGNSITTTDTVLAVVVVVGLLLRRASARRSERESVSSWQASVEPRAVPPELAGLAVVRAVRWVGTAVVLAVAVALPLILSPSQQFRAATVVAVAVLALSVVVLTGWTGQVTLGQGAFAAVGGVVAAVATVNWRFDLTLTLILAGLAAALAAVIVGIPSLRWQGIFLAVSTLAVSLAATGYALNPTESSWIPGGNVFRRPLLGVWEMRGDTAMYETTLAIGVLALVAVAGIRRSRVGRVLRAVRDNGAGAQAYGVRLPLVRLVAFALSGFLAGVAGALLVYINEVYDPSVFSADTSLNIFISSVVGGVGSAFGAVLGAGVLDGSRTFLSGDLALLPSAVGVLVVLLLFPGGLAELAYRIRDGGLRWLAKRRGIEVPSLVADRRVEDPNPLLDAGSETDSDADPRLTLVDGRGADHQGGTERPDPIETVRVGAAPEPTLPASRRPPKPSVPLPAEPGWLSIRGLDVAYDRVQVLFGVDLDVAEGQITALLGTNGAGKSTLLRAIGGVASVTAGSIHLGDEDLVAVRPEQVPTLGIAQMPGGQGVFPSLTVAENLRVAAWLLRGDRAVVAERIAEVEDRFPVLAERAEHPAGDLSGGQQQQLALAMALLGRPRILLIDELSLGLAPVIVEQLLDDLRSLRDAGTTIVVVEQSVNVALSIADHVYFMEKGEVRFSGSATELLAQPDLVRAVYLQGARQALAGDGGDGDRPGEPVARADASGPASREAGAARATAVSSAAAADDPSPALQVNGLSVSFGGIRAVDDVGLTVAPGEIVGLIGPNGAGKTTLFDLISGFTAADAGRVALFGQDISARPPSRRARAGLGRSFQDARLFPGLTVTETIAVALERWVQAGDVLSGAFRLPASQLTEAAVAERVDELVDLFALGAFAAKRLGELSTGSRRMVDLACVMAHRPTVVLLDEPSSGIAQREAEALGPVLSGLRDQLGASLLVIEHDIALVSSIADRLVALDLGRLVTSGAPAAVLNHPEVVASYLGADGTARPRSDQTDRRRPPAADTGRPDDGAAVADPADARPPEPAPGGTW